MSAESKRSAAAEAAAEAATRKIRESISRRAAARAAAGDEIGLEALFTATNAGRDTIADAYRKLTGRDLAAPTETPAEAVYRADADAGEQAEQIAQLVETLAFKHRENESLAADKLAAVERANETARKYADAVATIEQLTAKCERLAANQKPAPSNLGASITPQISPLADLDAENPDPKAQAPAPSPSETDALKAREVYISRETSELFSYIIEHGGIRPSTADLAAEYAENIPPSYRRRDGMPGDEMADQIATDRPEYCIGDERDLLEYFGARRRQARDARALAGRS